MIIKLAAQLCDDAEYPSLTPAQRNRAEEIASRACGGYEAEQAREYAERALSADDPEMLERAEMWAED